MATGDILTTLGTAVPLTITLTSLASSTAGVGRQSTLFDNTTIKAPAALITGKVKVGTTPTINKSIYIYLCRYDNTAAFGDDNVGTTDAGITILNSQLIRVMAVNSASTGLTYYFSVDTAGFGMLGSKVAIAVVQDTGVALDATGASHVIEFTPYWQSVQ